jgi:hypothetical protein
MTDMPNGTDTLLGELRAEVRNLQSQRLEILAALSAIRDDIKELRADHENLKSTQARLVNSGRGLLLGVAIAAGTAGASIKAILQNFLAH